jgi:hypothetical protein
MKGFLIASLALLHTLALSSSIGPPNAKVQKELPYTFFFTHYQLLGDPNNPDGVSF